MNDLLWACYHVIAELITEVKVQMSYRFRSQDFDEMGEKLHVIEQARETMRKIEQQSRNTVIDTLIDEVYFQAKLRGMSREYVDALPSIQLARE